MGYTVADSQSGYFALRNFLRPYQRQRDGALYVGVTGGLLNARGVIDALAAGGIDVGPLDSYSFDLLRHLEPDYAAQVRVIASTDPAASPAFVGTAPLGDQELARLREAFVEAGATPDLAVPRERLLIAGFAVLVRADYAPLRRRHDALLASPEVW